MHTLINGDEYLYYHDADSLMEAIQELAMSNSVIDVLIVRNADGTLTAILH